MIHVSIQFYLLDLPPSYRLNRRKPIGPHTAADGAGFLVMKAITLQWLLYHAAIQLVFIAKNPALPAVPDNCEYKTRVSFRILKQRFIYYLYFNERLSHNYTRYLFPPNLLATCLRAQLESSQSLFLSFHCSVLYLFISIPYISSCTV